MYISIVPQHIPYFYTMEILSREFIQRFLVPRDPTEIQKYVPDKVQINPRGPMVPRTTHDKVVVHSRFVSVVRRTRTEMWRRCSC